MTSKFSAYSRVDNEPNMHEIDINGTLIFQEIKCQDIHLRTSQTHYNKIGQQIKYRT